MRTDEGLIRYEVTGVTIYRKATLADDAATDLQPGGPGASGADHLRGLERHGYDSNAIVFAEPSPDRHGFEMARLTRRLVRLLGERAFQMTGRAWGLEQLGEHGTAPGCSPRATPHPAPPHVRGAPVSLPPLVEPAAELTIDEVRRYSRHLIIPDVGMDGQKRLKNAKVLVIGAGGLGSPALLYLAAAGVGTLGIAEFDEVDESNLQRQIIHGQSDIGKSKAISAQESIAETNPLVERGRAQERLDNDNVLRIFERLRPDRRRHRQLRDPLHGQRRGVLPEEALRLGLDLPLRRPGLGVLADARATDAPCYRCLYPEPPPPGMVPSCAEGGVLGVLCASIGSIQVNEAIKLLTGIGDPLVGKLMIYDALEMEYRKLKVRKDPNCALCGENPTVTELIDYDAFCGAISDEAADAAVDSTISVSHPRALAQGARQRRARLRAGRRARAQRVRDQPDPGRGADPQGRVPQRRRARPSCRTDKQVVLHCKTGVRSAEALAVVKGAGFADAVHVGGGVVAWVNQIDPSQPSY